MRIALALAALGAVLAAPALADPQPAAAGRGPVITDPRWIKSPTGEDFERFYPAQAARMELEGRVMMNCMIDLEGRLVGCEITSEDPPGHGFGDAALKMQPLFRLRPEAVNGHPRAAGQVNIPIRFQLPRD